MSADIAQVPGTAPGASPRTLRRDDLIAGLTGFLLILGLFLDGWNHLNLQNGAAGEFLTPWHGLLYTGFNACAIWAITRNERLRAMMFPSRAKRGVGAGRTAAAPVLSSPRVALLGMGFVAIGLAGDAATRPAGSGGAIQPPFDFLLFTGAGLVFAVGLRLAMSHFDVDRRVALPAGLAVGAAAAAFFAFGGHSSTTVQSTPATAAAHVAEAPGVAEVSSTPAVHHARAHAPARVNQTAAVHHSRAHRAARAHRAPPVVAHDSAPVVVAATPSALPTTHDSAPVVQHVASRPVARRVAPVAPARPQRRAAAPAPVHKPASKGVWTNVAVPDAPTQSSNSVTASNSTPDTPAPATPAQAPTP